MNQVKITASEISPARGGHFRTHCRGRGSNFSLVSEQLDGVPDLGEGARSAWRAHTKPQTVLRELASFDLVHYFWSAESHQIENTDPKIHPGAHRSCLQDVEGGLVGASVHPERAITCRFRSNSDLSSHIGWNTRINTESAHDLKLVVCRMNGANVSPEASALSREDAQRRRTRRCVKAEDDASGVEGQRDVAIICKTHH